MNLYTTVLFVHAIAVLMLTACLTIETWIQVQLRQARTAGELRPWIAPVPVIALAAISSLIIVFITGAYLTESLKAWDFAWPRFAVLEIVLFAILGALTGRRLRAIRRLSLAPATDFSDLQLQTRKTFLKVSLTVRIGIVLGTILLTAAKPDLALSTIIVVASLVLGVFGSFLPTGQSHTNTTTQVSPGN